MNILKSNREIKNSLRGRILSLPGMAIETIARKRWILMRVVVFILIFLSLAFSPFYVGATEQVAKWEWQGVPRIVAIGDVHGSLYKLVSLLQGTELVNDELTWIGGEDHLVMCGDLLDRGPDDRPVLDLLTRLESEAEREGGRVHVILGNHDVMNLVRDIRYIHEKGFADFIPEEEEEEERDRKKAWDIYKSLHSRKGITESELKEAFEDEYPAGFFGRIRAFEADGQYGSWLMSLPAVIKVNGIVFVHGGLTEKVAVLGLEGINSTARKSIEDFMLYANVLEASIKGPATFEKICRVAAEIEQGVFQGRTNKKIREAAKVVTGLTDSLLLDSDGPFWYRGNSLEDERLERERVTQVLNELDTRAVVVAHTPTRSGRITSRFKDRVIRCDVGMAYGGKPFALVCRGDEIREIDPETFALKPLDREDPGGQGWPIMQEQFIDSEMEEFLRKGEIKKFTDIERGGQHFRLVEIEQEELELRALVQYVEEKYPKGADRQKIRLRRYQHEIAAYWLDRKLEFDLVPVTVLRKVGKQRGSLSIWIESAVDDTWLKEHDLLEQTLEDYEEHLEKVWLFEALIDVYYEDDVGFMLLREEGRIMLSENTKAFSESTRVDEDFLPYLKRPLDPEFELALRELEYKELKAKLKNYLSENQIRALLERRDHILEWCGEQ